MDSVNFFSCNGHPIMFIYWSLVCNFYFHLMSGHYGVAKSCNSIVVILNQCVGYYFYLYLATQCIPPPPLHCLWLLSCGVLDSPCYRSCYARRSLLYFQQYKFIKSCVCYFQAYHLAYYTTEPLTTSFIPTKIADAFVSFLSHFQILTSAACSWSSHKCYQQF